MATATQDRAVARVLEYCESLIREGHPARAGRMLAAITMRDASLVMMARRDTLIETARREAEKRGGLMAEMSEGRRERIEAAARWSGAGWRSWRNRRGRAMATQAEEAMELMSCRRCGRYSGPEELCWQCERDLALEYEESIPVAEQIEARASWWYPPDYTASQQGN